jgi:glutamyl-tRNA synthetase
LRNEFRGLTLLFFFFILFFYFYFIHGFFSSPSGPASPGPAGRLSNAAVVHPPFLGGGSPLEESLVDHWASLSGDACHGRLSPTQFLDMLQVHLQMRTYIAARWVTLADACAFAAILELAGGAGGRSHVERWMAHVAALPAFAQALAEVADAVGKGAAAASGGKGGKGKDKDEMSAEAKAAAGKARAAAEKKAKAEAKAKGKGKGKGKGGKGGAGAGAGGAGDDGEFGDDPGGRIEFPNAIVGEVVTRFPPEPSGYLHIGHCKAALLNNYFARKYKGKLIIRFDDTNPSNESCEFVDSILADLATLGVKGDMLTYTSDHFPLLESLCERLIKEGKAYADFTDVERLRHERMEGIESQCRGQSVEENLRIWGEMLAGSAEGVKCCIRAKIDMQDPNKCMRDPIMYRCNATPHHRTGTKYKAYPSYDFACPIVDSTEGVTHALRTNEYSSRIPQYRWMLDALGMRHPNLFEFSRLNLYRCVLSKRKLQWFVDSGRVTGWNDPRFPTVQGIMRRGLTIEALSQFALEQGASASTNFMDWDKIWAINRKVLDPKVPRYVAISKKNQVTVNISGGPADVEFVSRPSHPKDPEVGTKLVARSSKLIIEQTDARLLSEGEEFTLMDWGNAIVRAVHRDAADQEQIVSLDVDLHLEGDFKKTKSKVTWIACTASDADQPDVLLVELDHLITKNKIDAEDNFHDFLNEETRFETPAAGDLNLRQMREGDFCQLLRRGFYRCDRAYTGPDGPPMELIAIPDGKVKASSVLETKVTNRENIRESKKSKEREARKAKAAAAAAAAAAGETEA